MERRGVRVRPASDPLGGWVGYPEATRFQMHDDGDLVVWDGDLALAGWSRGQWAAAEYGTERS